LISATKLPWLRGLSAASIVFAVTLPAQKSARATLTPEQVEEIREAGIAPDARISLYVKYLNEHVDAIRNLAKEGLAPSRVHRIDDELQTVAALTDELGSNLDQYSERKADIRKALKKVNEDLPKWQTTVKALPANPVFEVSRADALESCQDLTKDAADMLAEQTEYFKEHKDQRGQERAEPQ
jgi:DNA gyrase/topoisomerase IV subunit A